MVERSISIKNKNKRKGYLNMGKSDFTDGCGACVVVLCVVIVCALSITGGCLMGLATPPHFPTPMFIGGFVLIMIVAIIVVVFIIYMCTDRTTATCYIITIVIIFFCIFAITGGCLMGLATPPKFPTPMFIGGFVLIMIDAIIVVVAISLMCSGYLK